MRICNLRVENLTNPIGIDCPSPTFQWNAADCPDGWKQAACRVQVMQGGSPLWDSGRVETSRMNGLRYAGPALAPDTVYDWTVQVWDEAHPDAPAKSAPASFTTALLSPADWHGTWVGEVEDHVSHLFRHAFSLDGQIERASLFVCGLGHYELHLNGQRVGDRVLEPGWTNYKKSCLYSSYDVTDLVCTGGNAMGLYLGDGMFNLPGGRYVYFERTFGKMKFLLQLNIHYADGRVTEVVSGPYWRMAQGPETFSCMYGGLDYDARLEQDGFDHPDFVEGADWTPACIVDAPEGVLVSQTMPSLKVMETYKPVSIEETSPGVYLYDFGTNFSGWAHIALSGGESLAGRVVTLVPGEILSSDKRPDQKVTGRGYHWQYTLNDKQSQEYAPRFTYTGFRYVEVTGAIPRELASSGETGPVLERMTGEFIYPDIQDTGSFRCSNPLFNDIHRMVRQAMLSNMKSVLTDCPHRERLGWLEQTHLIAPGLLYNFDLSHHYAKIQRDFAEAQYENGLVPDICPQYVVFGYHAGYNDSPEWGSAAVLNPWYTYLRTGDTGLLTQYYPEMARYVDYLTSRAHHHVLHHGLGDWLDISMFPVNAQNAANTPVPVVATCIYYLDVTVMAETAALLGYAEDALRYRALAAEIRGEFRLQFLDKQNIRSIRVANGSQTAQAMALICGLIDEDEIPLTLSMMVRDIEGRGYATTAGDIGHPFVLAALCKYGRSDIVNRMTNVTDTPSYGYQVRCGATTLAEAWDGPNPERPHGSQNHFMLGAIEEWFYAGLAGLCSLRAGMPFDKVLIKPHFAEGMDEVEASTWHPYGQISIRWRREVGGIQIDLILPPGLTALFVSELDGAETPLASGHHQFTLHEASTKEN